jgi:NAD(P)-dependent dehydrogenase (short-subunit alcohol dehydrogenase family)
MPRTIVITGSGSGIGAATRTVLEAEGAQVIGVDLQGAEIEADLSLPEERERTIREIESRCDGALDGIVPCAGIMGTKFAGSQIVSVNYFGTVVLLDALRPLLAKGAEPTVVAISSNSTTLSPNVYQDLIDACLEGDEKRAGSLADEQGFMAYAASKTALSHWVRRNAVTHDWAGNRIRLNAVAPGRTRTAMDEAMMKDEVLSKFVQELPIPVGQPAESREIADFIAFLMGPKARFFCGSILFCDGGTDALTRPDAWPVGQTP